MNKREILEMIEQEWSLNTGLGPGHILASLLATLTNKGVIDEAEVKAIVKGEV